MKEISIKQICENIWEIEEKYDLFSRKIKDIYFWKLIRFDIFREIAQKLKVYGQAHTKTSQNFLDKLLYLPKLLVNTHLYGAIKRNTQKDILVFEHPRKVLVNGDYRDIYTDFFIKDLKKKNKNYEVIDRHYLRTHYNIPNNNRSYNEHFSFINFFKAKILSSKLKKEHMDFLILIKKEIQKEYNLEIDLVKLVKNKLFKFIYHYNYYDKLIKKRKPKKIYLVVSYGLNALIAASKDNNVTTIESQHGTMNKYHLGYSFPNNKDIPYFPDKLLLFGKYWYDSTPLPIDKNQIEYYGFPYMENRLNKYKDLEEEENKVTFISQGTIGKRLSKIAYELARLNKHLKIIYKLHPGEYDRWQEEYSYLVKGQTLDNFKIIDNNDIDLYKLLATSEYQVGVYSTAIYEGLVLDCKTILVDLPGIEYMRYLIKKGIAKKVNKVDDLRKTIKYFDGNTYEKEYFFS